MDIQSFRAPSAQDRSSKGTTGVESFWAKAPWDKAEAPEARSRNPVDIVSKYEKLKPSWKSLANQSEAREPPTKQGSVDIDSAFTITGSRAPPKPSQPSKLSFAGGLATPSQKRATTLDQTNHPSDLGFSSENWGETTPKSQNTEVSNSIFQSTSDSAKFQSESSERPTEGAQFESAFSSERIEDHPFLSACENTFRPRAPSPEQAFQTEPPPSLAQNQQRVGQKIERPVEQPFSLQATYQAEMPFQDQSTSFQQTAFIPQPPAHPSRTTKIDRSFQAPEQTFTNHPQPALFPLDRTPRSFEAQEFCTGRSPLEMSQERIKQLEQLVESHLGTIKYQNELIENQKQALKSHDRTLEGQKDLFAQQAELWGTELRNKSEALDAARRTVTNLQQCLDHQKQETFHVRQLQAEKEHSIRELQSMITSQSRLIQHWQEAGIIRDENSHPSTFNMRPRGFSSNVEGDVRWCGSKGDAKFAKTHGTPANDPIAITIRANLQVKDVLMAGNQGSHSWPSARNRCDGPTLTVLPDESRVQRLQHQPTPTKPAEMKALTHVVSSSIPDASKESSKIGSSIAPSTAPQSVSKDPSSGTLTRWSPLENTFQMNQTKQQGKYATNKITSK